MMGVQLPAQVAGADSVGGRSLLPGSMFSSKGLGDTARLAVGMSATLVRAAAIGRLRLPSRLQPLFSREDGALGSRPAGVTAPQAWAESRVELLARYLKVLRPVEHGQCEAPTSVDPGPADRPGSPNLARERRCATRSALGGSTVRSAGTGALDRDVKRRTPGGHDVALDAITPVMQAIRPLRRLSPRAKKSRSTVNSPIFRRAGRGCSTS